MNRESSRGLSYSSTPVRGRGEDPSSTEENEMTTTQPSPQAPAPATSTSPKSRWLALYVLCLGDLMIVLDQSIVNVALPSIRTDLGFSQASLAWVVNAYLLTFGGFLLLSGRLGDLLGNRGSSSAAWSPSPSPRPSAAWRPARRSSWSAARSRAWPARGLRGRAGPDHGAVQRARRAGQGDGRLRLRDVRRRRRRRPARRRADRPADLALDLPRERPRRHRRRRRRPRGAARRRRGRPARPSSTSPAPCWSPPP